jgi:hypothetical protein
MTRRLIVKPHRVLACLAVLGLSDGASASPLKPALSGLSFLVGTWSGERGQVVDTGGSSTGSSTITSELGGAALLRRDHTNLFDASGKATGGFDQIMMIYPESGQIRADYFDGTHVIHYVSASVVPGQSVVFTSGVQAGAPVFKLAYTVTGAQELSIAFSMVPPGGTAPQPIATGTLKKSR